MALADIYNNVRTLVYGQGLGEKPPVRLAAANAAESLNAPLVTFTLATGEGAKVKPGNVLSNYAPGSADDAFVIYVTSINSNNVTGVNGGLVGAPLVGDDDLDGAVLEQNPLLTSHDIHQAIEAVVARHLWPDLYNVEVKSVGTPDLVDGQEAIDADVMEILSAHQRIGPTNLPIPFERHPWNVDVALASTGRMASFDWIDGGPGYYVAKTKITVDDNGDLARLIATGAAALALGGATVEATIQATKMENAQAVSQRSNAGSLLWRDFLTLKQEYARELGRDNETRIIVDRG